MAGIVLHVDMDYFYAQLEERENPSLKSKPVIVCMISGREGSLGAVATCNYVARSLGVRSGMPCITAKKKAPSGVLIPARRDFYTQVSDQIMEYLEEAADVFEKVSVDEAYLDVSAKTGGDYVKAQSIAAEIKERIQKEQKLSCSVGVGPNKLIAKIASGYGKPDGLTLVREDEASTFLSQMPLGKLYGIGDKAQEKLSTLGVKTIGDLRSISLKQLTELFGEKRGKFIHDACRGVDERQVAPREREQYGNLASFRRDTRDWKEIEAMITDLSAKVSGKLDGSGMAYKTVNVTFVTEDFTTHSKSKTLESQTQSAEVLEETAKELAKKFLSEDSRLIRRLGIGASNLSMPSGQKTLSNYASSP